MTAGIIEQGFCECCETEDVTVELFMARGVIPREDRYVWLCADCRP